MPHGSLDRRRSHAGSHARRLATAPVLAIALGAVGLVAASASAQDIGGGHRAGFAGAVPSAGGGEYLAFDADGRVTVLPSFTRGADLQCHSRAEAEELATAVSQSVAIHGALTPRWDTTVICGCIDDTSAEWQYSPIDRVFAKVGQWVT
jgi:hypothetical protein